MAMTTSNVKQIAVQRFFEGMIQPDDSWSTVFNYVNLNVPALTIGALTGVPSPGTWDGSAALTTAAIDSTGATAMTFQGYGVQVRINKWDYTGDVPGIVGGASRKLGLSIASKRTELAWAMLANAFTTETVADGKALCATDHTSVLGGGSTRSNAGTTALDRAAFLVAVQAMSTWRNYQYQKYDLGGPNIPKVLVVHTSLRDVAHQILFSSVSSDQMQVNTAGLYNTRLVTTNHLTDTNDWFVIVDPMVEQPITFWDRALPQLITNIDDDTEVLKMNATWAQAVDSGPQPDGIYGSSVT